MRPSLLACVATATLLPAQARLGSNVPLVPLGPGGTQTLQLDAGPANAGARYLLAGSASGTTPGFAFGGQTIPLNIDDYLSTTIVNPTAFLVGSTGQLDGNGRATASFQLPAGQPAILDGLILNHAYVVLAGGLTFSEVSSPVPVRLTQDLFEVETPRDGSTVGSPVVDVRGVLSSPLASAAGLTVTVNGTTASLTTGPNGARRFAVDNLTLGAGARTITVAATAGALSDTQAIQITVAPRPSNNVVIAGDFAYAARGAAGFSALNLETREVFDIGPPPGAGSVDDLCVADGFLFVLDASSPGRLAAYDLDAGAAPTLASPAISVPVSPFAGVSAAGGRVVVSGGTSLLTVRTYDATTGVIGSSVASVDLGIGQPDVLVAESGARAFVSTDFSGSVGGAGFGITAINLFDPPISPSIAGRIGLPGAGFSAGTQFPANFPIESANLTPTVALTAHGGGLSAWDTGTVALLNTEPLPFGATSVAAAGTRAFVVGGNQVRELDYGTPMTPVVVGTTTVFGGSGALTGVAANDHYVVFAANSAGTIIRSR